MSKRYIQKTSATPETSSRPAKRQRVIEIGAPNQYDAVSRPPRDTVISAISSVSTRNLKGTPVPSLSALSSRSFARNFSELYTVEEGEGERIKSYIQALPDNVATRLFDVMKDICGSIVPGDVITCFARAPTVHLSREMSHVNKLTIKTIARNLHEKLRVVIFEGFHDISDSAFAEAIPSLVKLEHLSLKGCTKVGDLTVSAIARNCPQLVYVNLNHTSTTQPALLSLLKSCTRIETLKIAALPKVTHTFIASLASLTDVEENAVGSRLKNLKLRLITTPNFPLDALLQHLPSLETLDVSWTDTQHLPVIQSHKPESDEDRGRPTYPLDLHKLSIMSLPIKPSTLPQFLQIFRHIQILYLGAIGGSDMPTMTNAELDLLTDVLVDMKELHTLSIARNRKLGGGGGSQKELARFVKLVGRNCQVLSLANIPNLKSSVLEGLLPLTDEELPPEAIQVDDNPSVPVERSLQEPSLLRDLDLSNTAVDDECVPYLASCKNLIRLNLVATKISEDGVLELIDGCTLLEEINLEKCRSVDRDHRKRIFEVWAESRAP